MMPDAASMVGLAGCLAALFSLLALRRYHAIASCESARLRCEFERLEALCRGQTDSLRRDFTALELSMQNTDEILREGRLYGTSRAQAMRLLRSGMSPDTAAATLGMAQREVKLLAAVAQLLTAG
jgi:hypothetical protein